MNYFLLFILFFTVSIPKNISGKYISTINHNYLQLKNDNTFIYESRFFHEYQHSTGKWSIISERKIILNSFIQPKIKLQAIESESKTSSRYNIINISLKIVNSKTLSNYKCLVYINDSLFSLARCDTFSSITINKPIRDIYFVFRKDALNPNTTSVSPGLLSPKYMIKYLARNNMKISVEFDDNYFYYRAFTSDTILVSRKSLKIFNPMTRKWESLKKVADDTKIFSRYDDYSKGLNPIDSD